MEASDVLKMLNFASWLALYRYLQEIGWHEKPRIRMHPPMVEEANNSPARKRSPNHPIELDLVEIKAHAFDELYGDTPGPIALELMQEVAKELRQQDQAAQILVEYFNKLKART